MRIYFDDRLIQRARGEFWSMTSVKSLLAEISKFRIRLSLKRRRVEITITSIQITKVVVIALRR